MSIVNDQFDTKELSKAHLNQDNPWVMYLIIRKSLNMTTGKIAAQVGHGVSIIGEYFRDLSIEDEWGYLNDDNQVKMLLDMKEWMSYGYRKVVLQADEKEWDQLKLQENCFLVQDAGLTQVEFGTETVIGLWPILKNERSNLVKRLRTL